jgi:hypothetical protein
MEDSSSLEVSCSKNVKPRGLVLKANNTDFELIRDIIKEQFPAVELLYTTTAPVGAFLRISKSLPYELQDSSIKPYTVEGR